MSQFFSSTVRVEFRHFHIELFINTCSQHDHTVSKGEDEQKLLRLDTDNFRASLPSRKAKSMALPKGSNSRTIALFTFS